MAYRFLSESKKCIKQFYLTSLEKRVVNEYIRNNKKQSRKETNQKDHTKYLNETQVLFIKRNKTPSFMLTMEENINKI